MIASRKARCVELDRTADWPRQGLAKAVHGQPSQNRPRLASYALLNRRSGQVAALRLAGVPHGVRIAAAPP